MFGIVNAATRSGRVPIPAGVLRDLIEFENRQQVLAALTDDYREAIVSYLETRDPHSANR